MDIHPLVASVGAGGTKTRMTFERNKDSRASVETKVAIKSIRCDARNDMRDIVTSRYSIHFGNLAFIYQPERLPRRIGSDLCDRRSRPGRVSSLIFGKSYEEPA